MGCVIFDTAGSHTWPWPDGVDRAVVITRGASGGGSSGTLLRGGAAGGAGAFAERLCLKTDPDVAIIVGAGGLGGAGGNNIDGDDGEDSSFLQDSTIVQNCYAAGGKGAVGPAGGGGGLAADSYGTIKFGGGRGGSSGFGDGGGGGGAAGCATSDGEDGEDDPGTDQGGEGGSVCPNTGHDSTGGGRGGNEFANGSDGGDGGGGGAGIRPGIGVFTDGGKGSGGYVSICWEDPEPTGYCVDDSCKKWWGFGQGCGYYRYGKRCFYYGYDHGYPPYIYGGGGWPANCCGGIILPPKLTMTIDSSGIYVDQWPAQTIPIFAVDPMSEYPGSDTTFMPTRPVPGYAGRFIPGPSYDDGTGFTPNELAILLSADDCILAPAIDNEITGVFNSLIAISCDPLYLHFHFQQPGVFGIIGTIDVIVTE